MGIETPPSAPSPKESKTPEEISLQVEINRAEKIYTNLFKINQDRENRNLNPFFNLSLREKPYLKEFIPTKPPEDKKITQEEVEAIQNKTVALIFETALQIKEPKPIPRRVNEDSESLMAIWQNINVGERYFQKIQKMRPKDVETVLTDLLLRSRRTTKEKLSDFEIRKLFETLPQVKSFLRKKMELLKNYTR